jgi:hypothetical protein
MPKDRIRDRFALTRAAGFRVYGPSGPSPGMTKGKRPAAQGPSTRSPPPLGEVARRVFRAVTEGVRPHDRRLCGVQSPSTASRSPSPQGGEETERRRSVCCAIRRRFRQSTRGGTSLSTLQRTAARAKLRYEPTNPPHNLENIASQVWRHIRHRLADHGMDLGRAFLDLRFHQRVPCVGQPVGTSMAYRRGCGLSGDPNFGFSFRQGFAPWRLIIVDIGISSLKPVFSEAFEF